ncbi:MAG: hypothetical protein WCC10_04615 [Tumebacillaceae bacterium]
MKQNIWKQMGFERQIRNEADQLITEIFELYFEVIDQCLGVSLSQYHNVEQMIQNGLSESTDYRYFWKWFDEFGLTKLQRLSTLPIPSDDEVLDFLDSELYTLETIMRDRILEIVVPALADTVSDIHKYLTAIQQTSATTQVREKIYSVSFSGKSEDIMSVTKWMLTNPADLQRVSYY